MTISAVTSAADAVRFMNYAPFDFNSILLRR
ncbi:Uncharacterised protein [Vibrio cholerae]|nr:Uncharacterised protein [Vibrio cholerae]